MVERSPALDGRQAARRRVRLRQQHERSVAHDGAARGPSPVIPYGHQSINDEDVAAVVEVLRGDWLTQGPHIEAFEASLCDVTGARHAVAFSSGTAALHGATAAAQLGPGCVV